MSELQALIQWIADLLSEYLYTGVFLAALLETIIPPIPTMAVFPTAGFIASQNGLSVAEAILLGIVGGLGASIGSTVIYLIALKLGRTALSPYFSNHLSTFSNFFSEILNLPRYFNNAVRPNFRAIR